MDPDPTQLYAKCQKITNEDYANMQDVVWYCTYCSHRRRDGRVEGTKLFERNVDDIICTVRDDPDKYFKFAKFITQKPAIYIRKIEDERRFGSSLYQRKCEQRKQNSLSKTDIKKKLTQE